MSRAETDRLRVITQLLLDHDLWHLRAAAEALARSKAQLAEIGTSGHCGDLPLVAHAQAELTYQRWADQRRSELNLVIARQTAEWLAARERAKRSFGRDEVLQGLSRRSARP